MRVYTTGDESPTKCSDSGEYFCNCELFLDVEIGRFSVLYAKASTRKHKKWEGDGILICYNRYAVLKSENEVSIIAK